mmetsp:Transcript_31469/g.62389  ORF Transcript_31469/g.62389 Transcript_31469/m.62389 type:complete len:257 (+) Transcript_31469:351-1121(+)|eukprot:CAMPEP_0182452828 /NCGR_PEP_ID=MMETSP1319-20130603/155_1 /TAXON_ID=172717 /ORGANISM="Bolidomonas pacifica, Strain RCC208" /LENGTH=256 /DNA_ID=CAMNT_0024650701 /DNA_START=302 /DNA_END=1072 /DNA_ORIENTATION=-
MVLASDLASLRKRKADALSSGGSFVLSAPQGSPKTSQPAQQPPSSFATKRFKKSKSYKSFHDLSFNGVSGVSDADSDGYTVATVTPNSEMFSSYVKAGSGGPMRSAAVSEDGSVCSSRRNSETCSSLDLRSLTDVPGNSSRRSLGPNCVSAATTPSVSAPPSLPNSPKRVVSKSSTWGWFINMDIPSLTSNRELKPRRVVSSSSLCDVPLAFVKEQDHGTFQRQSHPNVGEDRSLTWAKAADVVDELLGGLDMPEF